MVTWTNRIFEIQNEMKFNENAKDIKIGSLSIYLSIHM